MDAMQPECAMTWRTNDHIEGPNRGAEMAPTPDALEQRRQEAIQRYLDGDPIEQICRERRCAKSWLYKWKNRYQVTEPDWARPRSRRPVTTPSKPRRRSKRKLSGCGRRYHHLGR